MLQLGAVTGRITLGIVQDDVPVHALDADPATLDRPRQKLAVEPSAVRERVVMMAVD